MLWKQPPRIKIYEALGCLADGRIEVFGNTAQVSSSSRGKSYAVTYSPEENAIMANDNGSYWQGYLGYPSIAFLLATGQIPYDEKLSQALKDIAWKDINTRFKNDFTKTEIYVNGLLQERGIAPALCAEEIDRILDSIDRLSLSRLGKRILPPKGY